MKKQAERQVARIAQRRARFEQNLFSRLPSVYAATRVQAQRLLQAAGGLSIVEWRVLWDLAEAGPMTISEMAELQRVDHSQLSRALPSIRKKGYVKMRQDSRDGRQMLVELTPSGLAEYQKAAPIMQRRRALLKTHFSEAELTQFIAMLDRFETLCRAPIDQLIEQEPKE